jgi:hypothetical protein
MLRGLTTSTALPSREMSGIGSNLPLRSAISHVSTGMVKVAEPARKQRQRFEGVHERSVSAVCFLRGSDEATETAPGNDLTLQLTSIHPRTILII